MCILAISVKVAIDSLENLTIKRIFLRNFFRVVFDINRNKHRSGFLEAPE